MEPCPHGLDPRWCAICRSTREPRVYVTDGGTAYHEDRRCSALLKGQRKVSDRGGTASPVRLVAISRAQAQWRPCRTCIPKQARGDGAA